jgi:hypothetical protein
MTEFKLLRLAPALIDAVLGILPDKVEVTDKGDWKYHRSSEEVPGSIKIVEVEKHDGVEFRDEYHTDGVRPKGLSYFGGITR